MKSRHILRLAALAGAGLTAAAFAGLSLADARPQASAATAANRPLCVRFDTDDPQLQCIKPAPRGRRGLRGAVGRRGPTGPVGPVGLTGPVGVVGPLGPIGPQGFQGKRGILGLKGIQGPPGAFVNPGGTDPGGSTVIVVGTKIGPIVFQNNAPGTGTELIPSVARCPTAGPDQEAFDGGAIITTSSTKDVVGLESSFPGLYAGQTEVDPLPLGGATPGAVSAQPANAYEAQAVVTEVQAGDNVIVQAYVVCGP
jgi:hypothetical protein